MSKDFLSQDEVDALLRGVTGEDERPQEQEDKEQIRPYDLAKQERIVRGRMPTLEIINERFGRLLRIGLFNLTRRTPEVSVGPVKVQKFSEFVRNLVVPTNLNVVQIRPLRGAALFVFDPSLVYSVIDSMFGGDGRFHSRVEGRDFTPTEHKIITRMLDVVFKEYAKSWEPVYPLQFDYIRSEMHTQFANIATPGEIIVSTNFNIEFGSSGGTFSICVPYATIEPLRDLLYNQLQGDQAEPDRRWMKMLSKQVQYADVEVTVRFAQFNLAISDLLKMREGDFIPLELPETVEATIDGVPIFDGSYGISNNRYALKIDKILAIPAHENQLDG